METPLTRWKPSKTLTNIDNSACSITCVGYTPSQRRRCHNPIAAANRQEASKILAQLSSLKVSSTRIEPLLEELAQRLLCRRNHQDQCSSMVAQWQYDLDEICTQQRARCEREHFNRIEEARRERRARRAEEARRDREATQQAQDARRERRAARRAEEARLDRESTRRAEEVRRNQSAAQRAEEVRHDGEAAWQTENATQELPVASTSSSASDDALADIVQPTQTESASSIASPPTVTTSELWGIDGQIPSAVIGQLDAEMILRAARFTALREEHYEARSDLLSQQPRTPLSTRASQDSRSESPDRFSQQHETPLTTHVSQDAVSETQDPLSQQPETAGSNHATQDQQSESPELLSQQLETPLSSQANQDPPSETDHYFAVAVSPALVQDDHVEEERQEQANTNVDGDCAICLESLGDQSGLSRCTAQCGQHFHQNCIAIWLATDENTNTCPYCRAKWAV